MWYFGLLFLSMGLCADIPLYNTYKGIEITSETLADMLPAVPSYMQVWYEKNKIPMRNIVPYSLRDTNNLRARRLLERLAKEECAKQGFKDLGGMNHVFLIQEDEVSFFIKSSPFSSRTRFKNGSDKRKESPKKKTYITAYQVAHYLVLQEYIEKYNFKYLRVPWTSLIYLSPKKRMVDDDSCFCVQEHIAGKEVSLSELPVEVLKECLGFCVTGVWDWAGRNFLLSEDGFYYFIDLGPSREFNCHEFYKKDEWGYLNDVCDGFNSLLSYNNDAIKVRCIVEWLENNQTARYVLDLPEENVKDKKSAVFRFKNKIAELKKNRALR